MCAHPFWSRHPYYTTKWGDVTPSGKSKRPIHLRPMAAVQAFFKFLASHQLAGFKMVLSRDDVYSAKKVKLRSCRYPRLLIWHFLASGIFVELDADQHAALDLLGLGAILVLPLARMPLLKLCWQRGPQVFFQAVFVIWPIWADISTATGRCVRITTLGHPPASRV